MVRLAALAIGYVFGLFQTAYIYGRMHGIDIRKYGSGNAGTTNTLRVVGDESGAHRVRGGRDQMRAGHRRGSAAVCGQPQRYELSAGAVRCGGRDSGAQFPLFIWDLKEERGSPQRRA